MDAPAIERTSAAKAGWVVLLALFAWVAFLLVPGPKSGTKPGPTREPPAPSKLAAVGLPDNPDLEGLPEYFAIWADRAEWVNDRTKFAYWSPGTLDYSYVFEAIREGGHVRFRRIGKPEGYDFRRDANLPKPDEHPLLLIRAEAIAMKSSPIPDSVIGEPPIELPEFKVSVDLPASRVQVPPVPIEVGKPEQPHK